MDIEILYFAYGSNMNFKQMEERCPESSFICKALLEGFKFVFDGFSNTWGGAVANVVESSDYNVEGGLFKITESDLSSLDIKEGCPHVYKRGKFTVNDTKGNNFLALVYKRVGEKIGKPTEKYLKTVLEGANNCNLSEQYIKEFLKK